MISKGDVIQVNESLTEWCGCLMIVDEIKPWGVMASMRVPGSGITYMMLLSDQYEYIGKAVLVMGDEEDEN